MLTPVLNFDNNIEDNSFILVMDDAAYSGYQLTEYLLDYFDNVKSKKLTFYVLVSYVSLQVKNRIIQGAFHNRYSSSIEGGLKPKELSHRNKNHKYVISKNMQPLNYYLKTKRQIYNIFRYHIYPDTDIYLIYNMFKNKYPIYFDHKLADIESSFPDIYGGILPSIGNKK